MVAGVGAVIVGAVALTDSRSLADVGAGLLTVARHGTGAPVVLVVDAEGLGVVVVLDAVVVGPAVLEVLVPGAVVELVPDARVGELGEPGATGCRPMVLVVDAPAATCSPCDLAPVVTARAMRTTTMAAAGALIHQGDALIALHAGVTIGTSLDACPVYRMRLMAG
jgi:hypothetical protein